MIKFYGQIKDGVLQQICGVDSDETLAAMKLANQGVEFVPTPYFGGASEFYYDGAAVTPKPEKPEPHYYWDNTGKLWLDSRTPAEAAQQEWGTVRIKRSALLSLSDWTQVPDSPVDKTAWATYRQALRDITLQADPFNIAWPAAPA